MSGSLTWDFPEIRASQSWDKISHLNRYHSITLHVSTAIQYHMFLLPISFFRLPWTTVHPSSKLTLLFSFITDPKAPLSLQLIPLTIKKLNKLKQLKAISVQFSRSVVSDSLRPHGLQHAKPPCPAQTPGVYSDSCPLRRWCHATISSSVIPFSTRLQSFPTSGSFQMSQLFASGGQSTGVSASTSVLPMNIQDGFPLGWTGWISLKSKGLSRVFSNTTVQKHQFFGT